jgi:ribosomal-protein-alanine N-acetyltransferase
MEATAQKVHIRWMIRRDMPGVLDIEATRGEEGWSEKDFLKALAKRNVIGMVAESNEKILGFMVYELHKSRLHLTNLAVLPTSCRSGIGSQLVQKLISKLSSHRRTRLCIDVPDTNLAAHLFLKANGFQATRVDRGRGEASDTYRMVYRIVEQVNQPDYDAKNVEF